jgi:hypothetical protein
VGEGIPEGGLAAGEEREEEKEEPDAVEDTEFVLTIQGDSTVNLCHLCTILFA